MDGHGGTRGRGGLGSIRGRGQRVAWSRVGGGVDGGRGGMVREIG